MNRENMDTPYAGKRGGLSIKPAELKRKYIQLRAEGKSYSLICAQLHISKSTCAKWERDLSSQINELKRAEFAELCESYSMTKEARIKRLGNTLEKINAALEQADFSTIDPAKLLDFKLKYTEALKGEYIGTRPVLEPKHVNPKTIVEALADLLNRVRAGDITTEQAQKESLIISQLLKAYDTVEIKTKLDELEAIIGGRQ